MKPFLLLFIIFFNVIVSFGQRQMGQISYRIDTLNETTRNTFEIIDRADGNDYWQNSTLVLINGKQFSMSLIPTLNLDSAQIKSFEIDRLDTIVNNVQYYHKLSIVTINEYSFNPVNLESIRENYSDNQPTVFLVNNEIVTDELKSYFLNEDFILLIEKGKIKSLGMNYMSIFTKTEENKKKYYNIYSELGQK